MDILNIKVNMKKLVYIVIKIMCEHKPTITYMYVILLFRTYIYQSFYSFAVLEHYLCATGVVGRRRFSFAFANEKSALQKRIFTLQGDVARKSFLSRVINGVAA